MHRNAGSSPSIASTTSSTVISAARAREAVAAPRRPSPSRAHPRRASAWRCLARYADGHAVVLGELRGAGSAASGGERREQHAHVHAPLDAVGQPHNPDTTYPRYHGRIPERPASLPCSAPMATVDEVELLPDAEQHKLLVATLERVNRASNAARAAALQRNTFEGAGAARDREGRDRAGEAPRRVRAPDPRPGRGVAAPPGRQAAEVLDSSSRSRCRRRRSSGAAPTGSRCSPRRAGARSRCASTAAGATCARRSPAGRRCSCSATASSSCCAADVERKSARTDDGTERSSAREVGRPRSRSIGVDEQRLQPAADRRRARRSSRVSARPTPCGSAHAPDSRQTHSPAGCRCTWIVTSGLIADRVS